MQKFPLEIEMLLFFTALFVTSFKLNLKGAKRMNKMIVIA